MSHFSLKDLKKEKEKEKELSCAVLSDEVGSGALHNILFLAC